MAKAGDDGVQDRFTGRRAGIYRAERPDAHRRYKEHLVASGVSAALKWPLASTIAEDQVAGEVEGRLQPPRAH